MEQNSNATQTALRACTPDDRAFVLARLAAFNRTQVPTPFDFVSKEISRKAVDDTGATVGGIFATMNGWGCVYVELLWVDESHRGQGLGARLLAAVEAETKRLGGSLVHLNTADFQAEGFYRKQGYQLFGTLEGNPPGHKTYYLKKDM